MQVVNINCQIDAAAHDHIASPTITPKSALWLLGLICQEFDWSTLA